MSLSGIKAGKAFVELEALDKTAAVLKGVERNFQAFGKRLSSIGSDALGAFGASLTSIGTKLTGLSVGMGGALAAGLIPSIKAASDSQESLNKFQAVFKEQSEAAGKFADELAKTVGRSATEIRGQMSAFQAFFVGLGFDPTEARELSQQIQQATLDLGSFHNLSDQEAGGRFLAALSGSSEVLDQFGINIKQAAINQKLLDQGFKGNVQNATEAEKTLARVSIILDAMNQQGATGDAEKTAGSFANRLKALSASFTELKVAVGTVFLDMAQNVVAKLADMSSAITTLVTNNGPTIARFAKIITGVSLALGGIGAIATFAGLAVTALGTVLGAAGTIISAVGVVAGFIATPLGLMVIAIGAATAGFVKFLLQSQSLRAFLAGPFVGSLESVAGGLEAVVEALAAGDMQATWEAATMVIELLWVEMLATMRDGYMAFLKAMKEATISMLKEAYDPKTVLGLASYLPMIGPAAGAAAEFLPSDDKSSSAGDAIGYLADLDLRREQLKTQLSNLGRDFGLNADGPSPEKANFLQIAQDAGKAAGMLVGSQIVADLPTELTLPEIERWNAAGNEMFSDLVANLGNAPDMLAAGGSGSQYSAMTAMEKGSIDAAKMAIEIMMRGEGQDDEAREKRKIDLLQNIDKNLQQPPVNLHIA